MTNFYEQINRIKKKLIQAKNTDKDFRVFGASGHKYQINQPATINEIKSFETKYDVLLPQCYQAFLLKIGNGGTSYLNSGVGPYYGIFPLGENVDQLMYWKTEEYLKKECSLYPNITDKDWHDLNKTLDDEDISDDEYYIELAKVYSGILPIGSQGCSAIHAIVLNGLHEGKVIYLDRDLSKPRFTFENNFLDWYERWLDEIISGHLIKASTSWYGYSKKDEA